jgi:SPP1 gp7 family putative phage head morphogenesis protein
LEQVSNIVMANMRAGMRPSFIEKALSEQFGVTARRAKMIARDQTSKVQGELNKRKQTAAGFSYFRWVDSHDQRVRHRHREISSKVTDFGVGVYAWSDLPLSDKGEPIQPGSDYQCRCVAVAVPDSKVKAFQEGKG